MKLSKDKLSTTLTPLGRGMFLYTAFHEESFVPVGSLWVTGSTTSSKKFGDRTVYEVLDCYVPHWARRNGIQSYLQDQLTDQGIILITGTGSREGGLSFMKAKGWKLIKETGHWYKEKK
jgi:hypothetical protein